MQAIENNPYRIAGVLANATTKEILSRKSKIKAFTNIGKEITSEYDFPFLPSLQRNNALIDKAFADIEQNQDKVAHALFWFFNLNPIDNTAIQHLINDDRNKAFEIWQKVTQGKDVTAKNFSAFNNIATLCLLMHTDDTIKLGIETKIKLIESESFSDFVHTVTDQTLGIDRNRQIQQFIDTLLPQLKTYHSENKILSLLFADCGQEVLRHLTQRLTEEPIRNIESFTKQTTGKRTANKSEAYHFGKELYEKTKEELTQLKSVLGTENLQYKLLVDNVAKELLQCAIDYFNESKELEKDNNYLKEAVKLAKLADTISTNEATKNRIKENINTLEEINEKELSQAIQFLKSVKEAYEKAYSEIGIMPQLSINKKVVLELSREVLSDQALIKIASSEKYDKITEFYDLLKYVDENIVRLSLKEKEEILYRELPSSNETYKAISKQKEAYRIYEESRRKAEIERQERYNKAVELGDNAFQSKKWEDAIENYEEALKIYPYSKDKDIENKLEKAKNKATNRAKLNFFGGAIIIVLLILSLIYLIGGWNGLIKISKIISIIVVSLIFGIIVASIRGKIE